MHKVLNISLVCFLCPKMQVFNAIVFWEFFHKFLIHINLYIHLSPPTVERESEFNQVHLFSHLKDFASPFIFINVTMMMHLMFKSGEGLKSYQSVLGDFISIFMQNIFTFLKARVFELDVVNQINVNLLDN